MKLFLLTLLSTFLLIRTVDNDTIHLFMIGDSTMSDKTPEAKPETGWGQVLQDFFTEKVKVSNHAKNGRSSKSFIDEGRWKVVLDSLKKGDYVIMQFGHNDAKPDSARHTDPYTSYKANLKKFITETRSKGAYPILCTSIVRRKFDEQGNLMETHGEYPGAAREVAAEMGVPLLDLHKQTQKLIADMGPEASKKLYLHTAPGEYPNRPEGTKDDTHLRPEGAKKVASLAVQEIKNSRVKIKKHLK